jgi:hypothetical protein
VDDLFTTITDEKEVSYVKYMEAGISNGPDNLVSEPPETEPRPVQS